MWYKHLSETLNLSMYIFAHVGNATLLVDIVISPKPMVQLSPSRSNKQLQQQLQLMRLGNATSHLLCTSWFHSCSTIKEDSYKGTTWLFCHSLFHEFYFKLGPPEHNWEKVFGGENSIKLEEKSELLFSYFKKKKKKKKKKTRSHKTLQNIKRPSRFWWPYI